MARPKGSSNKIGSELKEHFLKTFHHLQIDENKPFHLVKWAQENPKEFYALTSKLFPTVVEASVEGEIDHNVTVKHV